MGRSLLRTDEELSQIYYRHVKTVYRVCYLYMKNQYDAEDMVQKAFIRLMRDGTVFQSEEHEKAWLIRTATNLCKDYFRSWWSRRIGLEEITDVAVDDPIKIVEIAKILGKKESTIRGYLHSGRKYLKLEIGGEIK